MRGEESGITPAFAFRTLAGSVPNLAAPRALVPFRSLPSSRSGDLTEVFFAGTLFRGDIAGDPPVHEGYNLSATDTPGMGIFPIRIGDTEHELMFFHPPSLPALNSCSWVFFPRTFHRNPGIIGRKRLKEQADSTSVPLLPTQVGIQTGPFRIPSVTDITEAMRNSMGTSVLK